MRSLSSNLLAGLSAAVVSPVYLFRVEFNSTTVYATSGQEISFGGDTYNLQGAELLSLHRDNVRFALPNDDRSMSALALNEQILGNAVDIFLWYNNDALARFQGVLDAPRTSGDYNQVIMTARSAFTSQVRWPVLRLNDVSEKFLPPPGKVIQVGNTKVILEKEEN